MTTSSIERSVTLDAPLRQVWGLCGDFHGMHRWHPFIAESVREVIGDEEFRLLRLGNGGMLLEHLEWKTRHGYGYVMLRGSLSVRHYHGRFEAHHAGAGTRIVWSSHFEPTAPDAAEAMAAAYEAGLSAIAGRIAA